MHPKSAQDIDGLEYDWLGSDADGHVALFSTAGGGYAPDAFLMNTDAHDAAIEAILAEPPRTTARFAPSYPENTWRLVAQRGVFAFDSDPRGGPYKLVAAPEVVVLVDELPKVAADVVRRLRFPHLNFAQLREISTELLLSEIPMNKQCEPFCEIGDLVEFIEDVITTPLDGQQAMRISIGARYVARSLVNAGWDLRRKEGEGPDEIRILNSEMQKYVKVVTQHE